VLVPPLLELLVHHELDGTVRRGKEARAQPFVQAAQAFVAPNACERLANAAVLRLALAPSCRVHVLHLQAPPRLDHPNRVCKEEGADAGGECGGHVLGRCQGALLPLSPQLALQELVPEEVRAPGHAAAEGVCRYALVQRGRPLRTPNGRERVPEAVVARPRGRGR